MNRRRETRNRRERTVIRAFVPAITLCVFAAALLFALPAVAEQGTGILGLLAAATGSEQAEASGQTTGAEDSAATSDGEQSADALSSDDDDAVSDDGADNAAALSDDSDASAVDSSDTSTDSDSYGDDIDPVVVYLRVLVDGTWKYVGKDGNLYDSNTDTGYEAITVTKQANRAGGDRAIIPVSVFESALTKFGFSADAELKRADKDYSSGDVDWGNFVFGYCDSGAVNIYNDVSPQLVTGDDGTGSWYVFTKGRQWIHEGTDDKSLDVFYLPANRNDGEFDRPASFFSETYRSKADAQLIADNSFYTVTVDDSANRIYDAGEVRPSGYVNTVAGASKRTFTVKAPGENYNWKIVTADGNTVSVERVVDNGDGTLTYTLSGVTGPVTFMAADYDANKFNIVYKAEMDNSDRTALGNIAVDQQVITSNTTIGEDEVGTLTVPVDATGQDSYELLAPNSDVASVYWTQSPTRKFIYTFMGWRIVGDSSNTLYQAGEEISYDVLKLLAHNTGSVTLKSVWSANDTNTTNPHIRSANFYLNLNCEILDVDGSSSSAGADSYTQSIYSTRVSGTDTLRGGTFTLLSSESSTSAYDVDAKIRNATSTGTPIMPPSSWTEYTQDGVSFERFPTDEEVLQQVRNLGSEIKIDDEVIPTENLTSSNFTVRWYVVKYDDTDGWHIDGVLVAKKARLVVNKTFEGETDALETFKQERGYSSLDEFDSSTDFHIDVTHETTIDDATTDVTDYQLLLVPDSELDHSDLTDRRYGYTSYDPGSNTYTWEIEARQDRFYTVKENNYYLEDTDEWNNLTWYEVHNSNSTYNTNGWTEYDIQTGAAVKVLASAYPTDVPSTSWQTVGFRNVYVHKGTLAVFKNDYTTGAAMGNVAFKVTQTGTGAASALYQKKGTNQYTTDSSVYSKDPDSYVKVEDSKALTNSAGVFFLSLAAPDESSSVTATYELTEDKGTVAGYDGPDTISFKMTYNDGIADGKVETTGGSSEVTWASVGNNQFILNIYNRSVVYTSVTAKKQWTDEASAKPVTVQLWRKYGDVDEIVPTTGASGSALVGVDGNECSNTVQLSEDNSWAFSWGNLPLFINNQSVTYHLRETWIGDPTSGDSVAYDVDADPEDGYANYAVTTEDPRYVDGAMPDAKTYSGDALRNLYPHDASSWTEDDTVTYADHVLLMVNNADVHGVISFTKKDRAGLEGKPLAGATFTLYSDAECTKELETQVSGSDGLVSFSKRSAGTYYFKEVSAPAGYSYDAGSVYRAVVSNGTPTITKVGDTSQTSVTSVYNKFGAGLNVHKIGSGDATDTTSGVSGAEFTLTKVDGTGDWAEPQTLKTSANGVLSFTGLDHGTYTLTESKSPAGYEAVGSVSITFTVDTDDAGKTTFTFNEDDFSEDTEAGFVSHGDASTGTNVAHTVTVRNKVLYNLPAAGSSGILVPTLVGSGLMCAATALWFAKRWRGGRHV